MSDQITLLADIGGTNTRVAMARDGKLIHSTIRRFSNKGRGALEDILEEYIRDEDCGEIAGACVAAAGPVRDDVAEMTNLAWVIRADNIARLTGTDHVFVLNDLQAQGHALGSLAEDAVHPILPGLPAKEGSARLVVGIGTGFNAAPVHEGPGGRVVPPSEAGHTTLPIETEEDFALKTYLDAKHDFASVEHVVSGRGLERLYAYLRGEDDATTSGQEILQAITRGEETAVAAGQLFVQMLGRVVGDLALTHLPFGGIYLIGGAARGVVPWLDEFGFAEAMQAKGRFSEFLRAFPVSVVEDDYAALQGCASYLSSRMVR
ncbi:MULTISPECIES: ROK family protein [Thioclava]|uniref:glucokinase n=1 Tax=Thioclava TaxID=285107 RepID=UPI000C559D03|nr:MULTISPECIES: ROK family protein [Thioclava]MAQ39322.1 glucokinase [Thioclava sp.]